MIKSPVEPSAPRYFFVGRFFVVVFSITDFVVGQLPGPVANDH